MSKLGLWNELLQSSVLEQDTKNKTLLLVGGSGQAHKSIVQSLFHLSNSANSNSIQQVGNILSFGYSFISLPESNIHVYSITNPLLKFTTIINNALKQTSNTNIQIIYLIEESNLNIEELLIPPTTDVSFNAHSEMIFETVVRTLSPLINFTNELDADRKLFAIALKDISQLSYNVNTMKTLDFLQQLLRLVMLTKNKGSLIYFDIKNIKDLLDFFLKLLDDNFNISILDDFSAIQVPPKFDSIEKIKALNEEFDFELWSQKFIQKIELSNTNTTLVENTIDSDDNEIILSAKNKYQSFLKSLLV